jgi:hypothetical protein
MQPHSADGAYEELLRMLGLANPVHLDDDHAFAADVGQVDERPPCLAGEAVIGRLDDIVPDTCLSQGSQNHSASVR